MDVQSALGGYETEPGADYQGARHELEEQGRVQLEAAARVTEAESALIMHPEDRRARSKLKAARKDLDAAVEDTVEAAVKLTQASKDGADFQAPAEH